MERCSYSSALHRSCCATWCVDSAGDSSDPNPKSIPLLLLSVSETCDGMKNATLSHHPSPPTNHQSVRCSQHSQSTSDPAFGEELRSPLTDRGEDDDGEEGREGRVRSVDNRMEEDSSLLHPEDEGFHLPRSSPVISRRHRFLSWHAEGADGPALFSSVPSSPVQTVDVCGRQTVTRTKTPKSPGSSEPSCHQEDNKTSSGNHLLSAELHPPCKGEQGLAEDHRGRGLSSSDAPPTPGLSLSSSRLGKEVSRSRDVPEFPADIYKSSCDLEKENAHFVVVDLVLEVLEGVKWTLSLDTHTQQHTHTHKHRTTHTRHQDTQSGEHTPKQQNTHWCAAEVHTHRRTQEEEDQLISALATDSEFEDCGVNAQTVTASFRESSHCPMMHSGAELLAQQLVLDFRTRWLPSQGPRRSRRSLRTSLQELSGGGVAVCGGSLTEEIRLRTRMRGTLSWAPPQFQIIFTLRPTHRRSDVMASQHFLCAGCGTEVEPRYIKKLRYCEYLSKYFCDCCHGGSAAVIPARVLTRWDFSRFPVSDFSKQLLDSVWNEPLFDLSWVSEKLSGRVRELQRFIELQEQLLGVKKLLTACRLSEGVLQDLQQLPGHLTCQPLLFSMDDLLRVKKGQLVALAKSLLLSATDHVEKCEVCLSRGFICEFCREKDVIFPFQSDSCSRCSACKACFHTRCFLQKKCPKCARIQTRRKAQDGTREGDVWSEEERRVSCFSTIT